MSDGVFSYVCTANVPGPTESARIVPDVPKVWNMKTRRWEAAAGTNRLNRSHWRNARGQGINEEIQDKVETVRNRSCDEVSNNPTLEGVIFTHSCDIVGPSGPRLRVLSSDKEYNRRLEKAWKAWFRRPALNRKLSGPALLRRVIRNFWLKGETLCEKRTDRHAVGPVQFRLNPIDPRRLGTPADTAGDPNVINGVRVDRDFVPQSYFIADRAPNGVYGSFSVSYTRYPADLILHVFEQDEEEQTRGVPWIGSALGKMASGADYETHVLEAAKNHAAQALFFYTEHPEATYFEVNEVTSIEPGIARSCPPGWKPMFGTPTQPASEYFPYLKERQREVGRPRSMPLIRVRLDASEHNMASARYDGQTYLDSLKVIRQGLSDDFLEECLEEIEKELRFDSTMPARPDEVSFVWIWQNPQHVDPLKEANAERVYMENGTLTYSDAVASHGLDVDDVIEQRRIDNERLAEANLPPVPVAQSSIVISDPYAADDENAEDKAGAAPPGGKTPEQLAKAHK
jgi:capsid protein